MKFIYALVLCAFSTGAMAQTTDYGYLKKEDQQYYKNDSMEGNNQRERIDSTVKEINKLHGEINSLKSDVATLKQEIEALKAKQK